jgi:O-antigen ligase/polysaccharide polymerase Wzy-like membrane protein
MGLLFTCLSIILTYFSPPDLVPSLTPYHIVLVVMIAGLILSAATFANRPIGSLQSPQYLLVIGLWAAIVLSHVTRLRIRWGWEGFYYFAPTVAIYFLVQINIFSMARIKLIAGCMIFCGVVLGFQGIRAYHTGYLADKFLMYALDDYRAVSIGNRVRALGIVNDPNDFAQYLLVCTALLGLFWKPRHAFSNVVRLVPLAGIMVYATFLTKSRGALLGLGALILVALYRKGRTLVAIMATSAAVPAIYILNYRGSRDISVEHGRIIAWGSGISALIRHPVFGVGFHRFEDVNDLTAHNSFVLCFTELGMVGYFIWMALLVITMMGLWRLSKLEIKTPEGAAFMGAVYSLRAACVAFLTTGWFLSRTYTETLYILIALVASLMQLRASALPGQELQLNRWGSLTLKWQLASIIAVYIMVRI